MFHWVTHTLVKYIEEGLIYCANLVISSIGALLSFIVGHLPGMPSSVALPAGSYLDWVSYGNYWFPVTYTLTLGASLLTIWFAWMVLAIPLRWAKGVSGSQ